MNIRVILKMNIGGQGYRILPSTSLDQGLEIAKLFVDTSYPFHVSFRDIDSSCALPLVPCISLSFVPPEKLPVELKATTMALSVGVHWVNRKDEYGRLGLSFWMLLLIDDNGTHPFLSSCKIGSLACRLERYFSVCYNSLAESFERAAKDGSTAHGLIAELAGLPYNMKIRTDSLCYSIIDRMSNEGRLSKFSGRLSDSRPFGNQLVFSILAACAKVTGQLTGFGMITDNSRFRLIAPPSGGEMLESNLLPEYFMTQEWVLGELPPFAERASPVEEKVDKGFWSWLGRALGFGEKAQ